MDRSILTLIPLLVQAAAVLGHRTFNVSTKSLAAQIAYANAVLSPLLSGENEGRTGVDPLLHRIDSTRAYLRQIAEIISLETRALETELAAIADEARSLVEKGEDGQMYKRRWKAKP
jgi:hypothetical protein